MPKRKSESKTGDKNGRDRKEELPKTRAKQEVRTAERTPPPSREQTPADTPDKKIELESKPLNVDEQAREIAKEGVELSGDALRAFLQERLLGESALACDELMLLADDYE